MPSVLMDWRQYRPPTNKPVTIRAKVSGQITTDIVLPRLLPDFLEWFPLQGNLSISRSFGSHPSGQFTFVTRVEHKKTIHRTFCIGSELEIFEIGFRVSSLTITEHKNTDLPGRWIGVSVGLGGKWEPYLDKPVPYLRSRADRSATTDCNAEVKGFQEQFLSRITAAQIASRCRAKFTGQGVWGYRIPATTKTEDSTTLQSFVNERLAQNRCFWFFSNNRAVEARKLHNQPKRRLREDQIMSEVSGSPSGAMANYFNPQEIRKPAGRSFHSKVENGLPGAVIPEPAVPRRQEDIENEWPLAQIYYPKRELQGPFVEPDRLKKNRPEEPVWKKKPADVYELYTESDSPSTPPSVNNDVKDIRLCFDYGGYRKERTVTTYEDGIEMKRTTTIWGFIIYGDDVWQWDNGNYEWQNVASFPSWQVVEESTTTQIYEKDYGYHIGSTTKGWKLYRHRQEKTDGVPETAILDYLVNQSGDLSIENVSAVLKNVKPEEFTSLEEGEQRTFLANIWDLYRFQKTSYIREEGFVLEPLKKYYPDMKSPSIYGDKPTLKCMPSGRKEYVWEKVNPDAVIPYFVKSSKVFDGSYVEATNPESVIQKKINSALDLSPEEIQARQVPATLTYGNDSLAETKITIIKKPGSTSGGSKEEIDERQKKLEYYLKTDSQYDGRNESAGQSSTHTLYRGRPPQASRKQPNWYQDKADPEDKKEVERAKEIRYFLRSPRPPQASSVNRDQEILGYIGGSGGSFGTANDLVGGTLSYPHADSLADKRIAARHDLEMANIQACGSETLSVKLTPEVLKWEEGDQLIYVLNGIQRHRWIVGISYDFEIQGGIDGTPFVTAPGHVKLTVSPYRQLTLLTDKEIEQPINPEDNFKKAFAQEVFILRKIGREINQIPSRFYP